VSETRSPISEAPPPDATATAPSLPRLLAGIPPHGAMSLDAHLTVHGPLPLLPRRRRGAESPLIGRVERAGLRGRGGAGFPLARKMRAVARARRRSVVVVNVAEGEPASLKDKMLASKLPHLLLDGGQLAAEAVGADELIVCVCDSASAGTESVAAAIEERRRLPGAAATMQLATVPGDYVAGQEAALVNHLGGGRAIPTFTPPMIFEQGVRRRPTLMSNAETLAHLALIARHGSGWFRELGTAAQPGSALVTLSGPVAHPGVYEVEHGAPLASLTDAAGGTTEPLRAALLGGYGGGWIAGEFLHGIALSDEHLAPHGVSLGAGVVLLLAESACPVAETVRVTRWLAAQSAGQCGPCVNGLQALARTVAEIGAGAAQRGATGRIERLASLVAGRGACGHPDGAVSFTLSALDVFAAEFADHARHGPCDACASSAELPLPAPARASAFAARAPRKAVPAPHASGPTRRG
jgi:NADH:ubiquinone oxidoreductase subunit F (NADH-binding)